MFVPGQKRETHMSIVDAPRVRRELEIVYLEDIAAEKPYEFVFLAPLCGCAALPERRCCRWRCHQALI